MQEKFTLTEKKKSKDKNDKLTGTNLELSRTFARQIAEHIHDRHGRDIVVLELDQISPVAMHFVIATATSQQQIRSVVHELEKMGPQQGFKVYGQAGIQKGRWAIVDFVDVVVHIFDDEYRRFYDLELLWGDAPRIQWNQRDPSPNE